MATHKPDAVAIRASPTPPVIADAPAPASRILKEPIIPVTVPSRPNNGEIVTVALQSSIYFLKPTASTPI